MSHNSSQEATPSLPASAGGAAPTSSAARVGVIYGVAAYGLWGVFPVYFKALRSVPDLEVLAHRIIWSVVFLALLMLVRRNGRAAIAAVRSRRTLLTLCATTCMIACNWGLFIWAVTHDRLLEASLGYFINPLVSVVLGFVFLRERLRLWQACSVGLAAVAVAYLTVSSGRLPVIALVLACSFGMYGLLRKTARVEALAGLTIETAILAPLALAFLGYEMSAGRAVFGSGSVRMDLLLASAGVITATPLLWFTQAARRLRLATVGFLQYLTPTGHFLLAVLAYGEPFPPAQLVAFVGIWTALVIYSIDTARGSRRAPGGTAPPPIE